MKWDKAPSSEVKDKMMERSSLTMAELLSICKKNLRFHLLGKFLQAEILMKVVPTHSIKVIEVGSCEAGRENFSTLGATFLSCTRINTKNSRFLMQSA